MVSTVIMNKSKAVELLKLVVEYWDKAIYTGLLISFVWMLHTKTVDPAGFAILCGTLLVIDKVMKKKPASRTRTKK